VVTNFTDGFRDAANAIWPGRFKPDFMPTASDAEEGWGLIPHEEGLVWQRIKQTPNWWLGLNAYSRNVGDLGIWLTSHVDHDIWFCTSRTPSAGMTVAKQTQLWLESCGLRAVNNFLGLVTIPNSDAKADFYRAAEIEWSIDDKPETVIACGLIDTFEHKAWLLRQPWNRGAPVHNQVSTMAEFLYKIEGRYEHKTADKDGAALWDALGSQEAGVDRPPRWRS